MCTTSSMQDTPEEKKRRFKLPKLPWPPGYLVLWVITLASIGLNVIVLRQIVLAREAAQQSIDDAIAILSDFQEATFTYTFEVDDTLVIETSVPIQETVPVPIHELIEVRTAATVTGGASSSVVPVAEEQRETLRHTFLRVPLPFERGEGTGEGLHGSGIPPHPIIAGSGQARRGKPRHASAAAAGLGSPLPLTGGEGGMVARLAPRKAFGGREH